MANHPTRSRHAPSHRPWLLVLQCKSGPPDIRLGAETLKSALRSMKQGVYNAVGCTLIRSGGGRGWLYRRGDGPEDTRWATADAQPPV